MVFKIFIKMRPDFVHKSYIYSKGVPILSIICPKYIREKTTFCFLSSKWDVRVLVGFGQISFMDILGTYSDHKLTDLFEYSDICSAECLHDKAACLHP